MDRLQQLVRGENFERFWAFLIVVNAVLIGVETSYSSPALMWIQEAITVAFVIELAIRFAGRESTYEYFSDGWNYFDVFVVSISFLPEAWFAGAEVSVLRTLRVLRVFRLLHRVDELRLMTTVLIKSVRSLGYTGILFFIFMYVYAVMGVTMFKDPNYESSVNADLTVSNPDPYGSIPEAMFTLFRILTGEDWTDLRYNLLNGDPANDMLVTVYTVSWMILSAMLLINLVVGAVVNNYEIAMEEERQRLAKAKEEEDAEARAMGSPDSADASGDTDGGS